MSFLSSLVPSIGGIVSGVGSLVGGLFGSSATKKAADNQLQATRETNQTNIQLAKEQRDWEYRMQQEQNAYNSLSAQRARAEEAGFSPYILGGSNSTMQSSLPGYQLPEQQVPNYELQSRAAELLSSIPSQVVSNMLTSANIERSVNDSQKVGAERQGIEIDNQYKVMQILADLEHKKTETKYSESKRFYQDLQNEILGQQKKELQKRASLENELIASQASNQFAQEMLARANVALSSKQYRWLDTEKRAQLAQTSAYIGYLSAQKGLTEAQTKQAIENAVIMQLQQSGIKSDNEVKAVAAKYADLTRYHELINLKSRNAKLGKDIDWYNYHEFMHSLPSVPFMLLK